MSDPILLEVKKNVALITLNQPKKLNALSGTLYYELAQLMRKVADMPDVTVTVLTGTGRYFSAGADVAVNVADGAPAKDEDERKYYLRRFAANNLEVAKAFYEHPKILVGALNGPAVENTFILTPFTSLGLVAEGIASTMFVRRLGFAKASEALLLSKRISAPELVACGFINKLFPAEGFRERVLEFVDDVMGAHLNHESMLGVKALMREPWRDEIEKAGVREAFAGLDRFVQGAPQKEFARLASGEKRHKL
ncbi:uncharacterized protein H6S33_012382 [Morchella sextelata]|uniref:uncharacterized protein n=1 Tax=Morchella sextelata TaxID=1174677 RepID=UPI001D03C31E|nr:uncharacterized protein H6S33_012382 [Morchella sextelata]KAH0609836.1 hypothetical protein H6S33_012382 [Morchella sextelata]